VRVGGSAGGESTAPEAGRRDRHASLRVAALVLGELALADGGSVLVEVQQTIQRSLATLGGPGGSEILRVAPDQVMQAVPAVLRVWFI
jgi:hypothetical protein